MEHNDFVMNSASLQNAFPNVYRDFFARCSIVCSAPRVHAIAGDHTVPYGGMMMAQRVTLRNYVGLEFTTKNIVRLAHHRVHVPDASFIDHDFSRIFDERLVPLITNFLEEHKGTKYRGVAIHVLTEGPPPRITGGYGGICAALSAVLSLAVGVVQPNILQQWAQTPTRQLLTDPTLHFDAIFRFALKLKAAFDLGVEGGGIVFASYLTSVAPTLFFWQKTFHDLQDFFPPSLRVLTFAQAFRAFDHVPYWGMNMNEIVAEGMHIPFTWPVDAVTVNIGKVVTAGYAQRTLADLEVRFRHFSDEVDKSFAPLLHRGDPLPPFYHLAKEQEGERMWEMVHRFSMKLSLTAIARFLGVFHRGVGDESLRIFLRSADTYRHWLNILDFDIPVQNHLADKLHNRASHMGVPIAVKPYAYGGEVLIMAPIGSFRDALQEELSVFQGETGIHCALDYVSWRDGFERDGLRVEQHLESGVTAALLGKDVITINQWDREGHAEKLRIAVDQLQKERNAVDLFLDYAEKKIFVEGKLLTSRELHSSIKVLEILAVLLDQMGVWVPSSALPQSSYIDRNEMQSKIVSPLRAVVKKRLKKDLHLELHGSVGSNFSMRFNPRGLTIAMRSP